MGEVARETLIFGGERDGRSSQLGKPIRSRERGEEKARIGGIFGRGSAGGVRTDGAV
jgi:hypothetical protein